MPKSVVISIVVSMLALPICVGCNNHRFGDTVFAQPAGTAEDFRMNATQWEYRVVAIRFGEVTGEVLNRLGTEGWELITVDHERSLHYFKRPKH